MEIRYAVMDDLEILTAHDRLIAKEELRNAIRLSRVYIAEEAGEFVGWLRYNLFWDNTPFLNMLYLLEDSRGKGIGGQMVEYWEHRMKALGYALVMTSTASEEYAQHFYHKLGYRTIGGFLSGGDPYEVILEKTLQP